MERGVVTNAKEEEADRASVIAKRGEAQRETEPRSTEKTLYTLSLLRKEQDVIKMEQLENKIILAIFSVIPKYKLKRRVSLPQNRTKKQRSGKYHRNYNRHSESIQEDQY